MIKRLYQRIYKYIYRRRLLESNQINDRMEEIVDCARQVRNMDIRNLIEMESKLLKRIENLEANCKKHKKIGKK